MRLNDASVNENYRLLVILAIGSVPVVYVTGNVEMVQWQGTVPVVDKPIQAAALAAACRRACAG